MKLQKLVAVTLLAISALIIINIFDKKSKIQYPHGITIVQVITKAKDGLTGRYSTGVGAGFFIDDKHIATNDHVVESFDEFGRQKTEVSIFDGKDTHPVKIVGLDRDRDIALLEPLSWCDVKIQIPCSNTIS